MNALTSFVIFSSCIGLDRITKTLALENLINGGFVVTQFLNFDLSWNRGISWGMLQFNSPIRFAMLSVFILLIIVLLVLYTFGQYRNNENILGEVLIISGAISNVIDRFLYSAVLDFIDIHAYGYHWPSFNLADSFIVFGVCLIFIKNLLRTKAHENTKGNGF
jgi:signal peptidase II